MELKTYQAPSMMDALTKVKSDLGRDAVILNTRTIQRGGVLGIGSKSIVEITATTDARAGEHGQSGDAPRNTSTDDPRPRPAMRAIDPNREVRDPTRESPGADSHQAVDPSVLREIQELRKMVETPRTSNRQPAAPHLPAESLEHYTRLIGQHVSAELARVICHNASADSEKCPPGSSAASRRIEAEMLRCVASMLPTCEPLALTAVGRPTVVALVGPTGVGKTTTLVKLAANMKLREGKKVGLITDDTHRIAAVDQLRAYAQIMKMPMMSVTGSRDVPDLLRRMRDLDLILIDTAGRSPRDAARIEELRCFLDAAKPDRVHLVLSCTSAEATMREAIRSFAPVGVGQVIFTKLDEAVGCGVILNVLHDVDLRMSYLTQGQSVPDDIEVANGQRVARLILGLPMPDHEERR